MQRMLCLILLVHVFHYLQAQTPGTNTTNSLVSKDAAAVATIQSSLAAMNPTQAGLSYIDSVTTGTLTTFFNGQRLDSPITRNSGPVSADHV